MPKLASFSTPALIQDLSSQPELQAQLNDLWNNNVQAFTQQAIFGNPWNALYASAQTSYYDPTVDNGDIAFTTVSLNTVTYAAPGNSYPSQFLVLSVSGVVSATAKSGLRGIAITNPRQPTAPYAPAMLFVG